MKKTSLKWASLVALGLLLMGCQAEKSSDGATANSIESSKSVETSEGEHNESLNQKGDSIEQDNHSHAQETEHHDHSDEGAKEHHHAHNHSDDEQEKQIYKGYFEDSQVEERMLSDWEGDWQSVYPYLLDGTLDEVFTYKAETTGKMTAEEYKQYYTIGYKTDTERIIIEGDQVTFVTNGNSVTGTYKSDGYEILTYEAGNRGVRYIFKLQEDKEGLPKYIQFSDHRISPYKADHYHLYWGDDRAALLQEVTNWPTYYPSNLDGQAIADEMMSH